MRRLMMSVAAAVCALGAVVPATASAAPAITCAGQICHNRGNDWGIGYGNYTCPNGIVYPSIAIVPPHGTAAVWPANCNPTPRLYF